MARPGMASMTPIDATLSVDGKSILCGICRRVFSGLHRERWPANPLWTDVKHGGKPYVHVLRWGSQWYLAQPDDAMPTHLEWSRYRRDPGDYVGAGAYIGQTLAPLARCECRALNRADPKTLHVQAAP
jgi:hypothetical protein